MLERVDMDVVDVRGEVPLITQHMLPVARLPDPGLAPAIGSDRHAACPQVSGEQYLELADSRRVVLIASRQAHHQMQVLRQNHHRIDMKGPAQLRLAKALAQQIDMARQQILAAIRQGQGEEIAGARYPGAPVEHHCLNLLVQPLFPGLKSGLPDQPSAEPSPVARTSVREPCQHQNRLSWSVADDTTGATGSLATVCGPAPNRSANPAARSALPFTASDRRAGRPQISTFCLARVMPV